MASHIAQHKREGIFVHADAGDVAAVLGHYVYQQVACVASALRQRHIRGRCFPGIKQEVAQVMRHAGLPDVRQLRAHPPTLPVDRMACGATVCGVYRFAFCGVAFRSFGGAAVTKRANVGDHLPYPLIVQRRLWRHTALTAPNYAKYSRVTFSLNDSLETRPELPAAVESMATCAISAKQLLAHGDIIRRHLRDWRFLRRPRRRWRPLRGSMP